MDIKTKTLNYLKSLTAETISNAKSGHTGSALGASSILLTLFHDHLNFDKTGTNWRNRDRFVLSAGHASGLLYSLLHLFGYNVSMDDLKSFRKYGSKTPGHPEVNHVPGVETTTGPLGQGIANAVGMAIGEEKMRAMFPGLISHYTYCYAGDGCLMEGVANEAVSLAGTLGLSKLIILYDDNNITIDGEKTITNKEDTAKKFEAMGWNVITVKDGNDYDSCSKAIKNAKSSKKPTIIIFKTIIGIGTKIQGTCKVHASPLSNDDLIEFKNSLGVTESFSVPEDVYAFCRKATEKNDKLIEEWNNKLSKTPNIFIDAFPEKKINYEKLLKDLKETPVMSGRDVSGKILSSLSNDRFFFGGTADLGPSTKAIITSSKYFDSKNPLERNIHFGIREHAMGSICNGIALYADEFKVFDSTFTAFSNYMLPSLKMRALMGTPVLSIFSHDSIDIGEDGPTHQPIEQIPQMRSLMNLSVWRPGTYSEVVATYKHFLESNEPVVLAITKNKIKLLDESKISDAEKGGYVLFESKKKPTIEILATGREIYLALDVAHELEDQGVRVISLPCLSEFEKQDKAYKNLVLLKNTKLKIAIEATNDNVWKSYVGENGLVFEVNSYQFSGNGDEVYKKAGFEKDAILKTIKKQLSKIK